MFKSILAWVTGSVLVVVGFFRALVICELRLNSQQAEFLLREVRSRGWCWVLSTELVDDVLPKIFSAYCRLNKITFKMYLEERMLRAGFQSVDTVAHVTLARWNIGRMTRLLLAVTSDEDNEIPIYILQPWDARKIGSLEIPETVSKPYVSNALYDSIDPEVRDVVIGSRDKLGALFYGPPGNGKSYLIRHFAMKYKLPLYIVSFTEDLDNTL